MVDIKVKKCVSINLSPEEVFAYVCELGNIEDWSSATISMKKTSPGEISAGTTVRSTLRFLGRWLNVLFEVVEYHPGRCLTFKSIAGSPPCLFRYHFEINEQGATIASEEAIIQIVGGELDERSQMIERTVGRQIQNDLYTLKDVLETGLTTP